MHLQTCDPWALDRPRKTRKTYLPEVRNGRPPTVHFKQHHQIFDVPLCVVADCETYREGNTTPMWPPSPTAWSAATCTRLLRSTATRCSWTRRATARLADRRVQGCGVPQLQRQPGLQIDPSILPQHGRLRPWAVDSSHRRDLIALPALHGHPPQ